MSAPRRCTACGEDVEPDDGGAIWYHPGNMSAFCDGDDDPDLTRQATPAPILTRRQLEAATELYLSGALTARGRARSLADASTYIRATLDALELAGVAVRRRSDDVYRPIVATWADGFGAWHVAVPAGIDNGAAVARAIIRGEVAARVNGSDDYRPRVELDTVSAPRDGFTIYREV